MTDRTYLIPINGIWLALDRESFDAAAAAGAQIVPRPGLGDPRRPETATLLTAEEIAARTGVEASWFLARARLNEIPFVRFGKYVRFDLDAVTTYLSRKDKVKS